MPELNIRISLLDSAAYVWILIGLYIWDAGGDVSVPVVCASIFLAAARLERTTYTGTIRRRSP